MNDEHIPVPLAHRPPTEAVQQTDDSLTIWERDNHNASITADVIVEVRQ